jgi:hypothetical protein
LRSPAAGLPDIRRPRQDAPCLAEIPMTGVALPGWLTGR